MCVSIEAGCTRTTVTNIEILGTDILPELTMSNNEKGCEGFSRRNVLTGTAVALGVAASGAAASRASAQQKIKQADAKYQDHPNGTQKCDGCIQFQAPNACKIVDGTISPDGWCQFFGAKPS
jgi:hypothetical protein